MNVCDGLYFYEIALLILGVVLFFVLVVILIVLVKQGRSIAPLLLFFVIAVLMIGFPAVSKVKFDESGVEIDKAAAALARNPSDGTAKAKLERLVAEIKPRATRSAEGLVKLARAEAVLGNPSKALGTLDQALRRDPELKTAKDLKARLKMLPSTNETAATRRAVEANMTLKQ